MIKKAIGASLLSFCCSYQSVAIKDTFQDSFSSWVLTVDGGPAWENAGQTQTFFLVPNVQNTYTADNTTHQLNTGELFFGLHRTLASQWRGELGLSVAALTSANIQGGIWQDANPEFNNFAYSWKTNNTRLSVKGKLLKDTMFYHLSPYVSLNLGASFNHAGHYESTALIEQVIPDPSFSSHTTTAFSYAVGVGVQRAWNEHMQMGIGYEFVDWGKSALAKAPGQTLGVGPYISHLYTNGLIFSISYLA